MKGFFALLACSIACCHCLGSERRELREPRFFADFPATSSVRLQATGDHQQATVRVNGTLAGELVRELDIGPFLRHKDWNQLEIRAAKGSVRDLFLLISPAVYISSVEPNGASTAVTIRNTSENTAQVELVAGDFGTQFTVSPGTSVTRLLTIPQDAKILHMTATSDGLDAIYRDEARVGK